MAGRWWFGLVLCIGMSGVQARQWQVGPGAASLRAAIAGAAAGDQLQLAAGHYRGNFVLDRAVRVSGQAGTVLDGGGQGDVLRVRAAGVVIEDLAIRNSGHNLTRMNAGIFVERSAADVIIRNNTLDGNLFGIWLDACHRPQVRHNRIHGEPQRRSQDRGNGIHLYAVQHGIIADNEVWETRDGIYIDTSEYNRLEGNYLHDLRYGVHYMYSYHNTVTANLTRRTRTGYALMQSRYLTVTRNRSVQDGNYGILMNFITNSTIADNRVVDTRRGRAYATGGAGIKGAEGKALFIYNAPFNDIHGNHLQGAEIGIHLTAGSEGNRIHGNAFLDNRVQVKYVANRTQEWSYRGRGNYWSDYLGWDLDSDGIGDRPYIPNDAVDKLLWKYPLARLLMSSPAIETLRWVQQQFPVLRPPGVRDSFPLMKMPAVAPETGS